MNPLEKKNHCTPKCRSTQFEKHYPRKWDTVNCFINSLMLNSILHKKGFFYFFHCHVSSVRRLFSSLTHSVVVTFLWSIFLPWQSYKTKLIKPNVIYAIQQALSVWISPYNVGGFLKNVGIFRRNLTWLPHIYTKSSYEVKIHNKILYIPQHIIENKNFLSHIIPVEFFINENKYFCHHCWELWANDVYYLGGGGSVFV